MSEHGPQPCKQNGCDGMIQWGRTVRDPVTGKGGAAAPIHYPFPVDSRNPDGTVQPDPESGKVPNLAVRRDQWGSYLARVTTDREPIRADERPAFMHHAFCKNPPPPRRRLVKRTVPNNQTEMQLGMPSAAPQPGPLSDPRLFPRRRSRRG